MPKTEPFKDLQLQFAAHIRNPQHNPAPVEIEDRRMNIYRELFFNNIDGFLSNTFPVLKSLYSAESWQQLVRDFYTRHHCHTPYFLEISREFIDYLQSEHELRDEDPPFMFELAHYEWVELALSISDEQPRAGTFDENGDLADGHPLMSPLAWLLTYQYPVHRISQDYRPQQPGETPTCIIVYRDSEDNIQFTEINAVTARLLQLLDQDSNLTGRTALEYIAAELGHDDPAPIIDAGLAILEDMRDKGILLGTSD
jgi:hypothetical protein